MRSFFIRTQGEHTRNDRSVFCSHLLAGRVCPAPSSSGLPTPAVPSLLLPPSCLWSNRSMFMQKRSLANIYCSFRRRELIRAPSVLCALNISLKFDTDTVVLYVSPYSCTYRPQTFSFHHQRLNDSMIESKLIDLFYLII